LYVYLCGKCLVAFTYCRNWLIDVNVCILDGTKVEINFIYNESVTRTKVQPHFVEQVGNVYVFEVVTSLAYVPVAITECQAHDQSGQNYDLSPLVQPGSVWRVATSNADNKYLINVCHSVGSVNATSCSGESVIGSMNLLN